MITELQNIINELQKELTFVKKPQSIFFKKKRIERLKKIVEYFENVEYEKQNLEDEYFMFRFNCFCRVFHRGYIDCNYSHYAYLYTSDYYISNIRIELFLYLLKKNNSIKEINSQIDSFVNYTKDYFKKLENDRYS